MTYAQAVKGEAALINKTLQPPQTPPTESAKQSKAIRVRLTDSSEALQVQEEPTEAILEALQRDARESHAVRCIVAAKKLPGGDVILHTSSVEAKQCLQKDSTWVKKLGSSAEVKE